MNCTWSSLSEVLRSLQQKVPSTTTKPKARQTRRLRMNFMVPLWNKIKTKLINKVKLQHLYFSFECQWGRYFLYSCFCPWGVPSVGKGCSHLTIICFTYFHKLVHIGALQTQTPVQCVSYMQLFLPLGGCTLLSVGRYRLVCLPLSHVSLWNLSRSLADKGKYQNRQNKLAECWVSRAIEIPFVWTYFALVSKENRFHRFNKDKSSYLCASWTNQYLGRTMLLSICSDVQQLLAQERSKTDP